MYDVRFVLSKLSQHCSRIGQGRWLYHRFNGQFLHNLSDQPRSQWAVKSANDGKCLLIVG
jgi:hypothetical protein